MVRDLEILKRFKKESLREKGLMCHTTPNLSFKDLIFESLVKDLYPFSKAEVYSLEQSKVVASQTWIKL